MARYVCGGFRAVEADGPTDAAQVFAGRLARRRYGRSGIVGTLRRDSWTEDGASVTFESFIGHPAERGGSMSRGDIVGSNEWLHVSLEGGA